ncbi:type VII secretion protein EccCa [Corynebacterium testudinoris]|uniref:Type VII secretion protein EccCa/type VII secretion protein EccCb n=1 Tax=Corynebacterium testudinoris TaxID=136857 RepID=A0A0G3H9U5_9CORY|nr:type VII secretion protein EccCa [Corynebacterium testudinoris]AKK07922.1 type VII secretion protein EccCa/type VII secretion protein EccCb [Corynebacterium testudinoris]MBX8995543.1 type VII secretion protein EccCa [Corynebacterium testudinoris]
MLGTDVERIVEPLTLAEREPTPPLPQGTLSAEAVPPAHRPGPLPLVRILMPIVMIAGMALMVGLMVMGGAGANPMMLLFPLMMGMSMVMMFAPPQGEDVDETRRTYLRHLGALRDKALANAEQQRAHEYHRHPAPSELWARVDTRRLWEKGAGDADELEVRIGTGDTSLCTPIQVADSGAAEDLDPVCAVSLRSTVRAVSVCPDMPVAVQLQAFRFLGISGPAAQELARAIVVQLVTAHGPERVGIEVIGEGWDWVKWLPHTREPDSAAHRILIVSAVTTTGTEPYLDDPTWTTIIDVGSRATTALGMRAEAEGFSLAASATELSAHTAAGVEVLGVPDRLRVEEATIVARALTRYRRPDGAQMSSGRDLTSLIGLADIDQLTPETMWPGRLQSRQRLVVPIGTTEQGVPVRLDLKESAQGGMGPHGLCIGATGSGKSELLRTLVVSLAATHSPEELNLVLVDFKGGATFLGCESLPHTSAVITNLADEAILVERMYDAISGELNRRQEVLRTAGNFANVSDYTAARLGGRDDLDPLPALFIVVDEFSELLAAHPDFADLFVAVGRLGRSLHVHLLLASQRLEEGRLRGLDSHLSYRIGLKTFSAAESRQVLGITDAHHLPGTPGAGFLKHDAEDITRFQAAYVSGPLLRRDVSALPGNRERRVALFTGWEQFAEEDETPTVLDESTTLLDAVVDKARTTAAARGQRGRRIWLEPLPPAIELAGVADDVGFLSAAMGIIDLPYHQRQDPLVVDFSTGGGHLAVCGGPQTGKSTALRSVVASLAATHATDQIRFYVLDLGGGTLGSLSMLPHVAGVADRHDPERVRRIVDEVTGFVDAPEQRHTFLVVDGWHSVVSDVDDLVEPITRIAADGASARVHLIISTPRWTILRPAIRDLITTRLELKLGESMDSLIDRKAQQKLPAKPGRGLTDDARNMLIALSSSQDLAHIASISGAAVPALKVLPERIGLVDLEPAEGGGIPLAVGGPRLETLAWVPGSSPHLVCIGGQGSGKSTLLRTVAAGISEWGPGKARLVVIDHRRAHLGALDEDMVAVYSATSPATKSALDDTVATLRSRLPGPDITPQALAARSWWTGPDIFVLIDDLDLVADHLLHPLVELLPHSRDIGLHLVIARKSGGVGRALFGPFLSAVRDQTPAVMLLDADRDEGAIFGIKPLAQPPGRGTWQVRGDTVGVAHVATVEETVEEEDS